MTRRWRANKGTVRCEMGAEEGHMGSGRLRLADGRPNGASCDHRAKWPSPDWYHVGPGDHPYGVVNQASGASVRRLSGGVRLAGGWPIRRAEGRVNKSDRSWRGYLPGATAESGSGGVATGEPFSKPANVEKTSMIAGFFMP